MTTTNPVLWAGIFPAQFIADAEKRVAKFNARARRAGIEAQHTTTYSTWLREEPSQYAGLPPVVSEWATFVVFGEALSVAGWTFIATLSFDEEAGVITRPVPDAPAIDLSELRTLSAPKCDQCGTARYRKDVYVLLNRELGELKVVGRNCLASFLGLDPSGSLNYINYTPEFDSESDGWSGVGGEVRVPAVTLIALASAAVAEYGWVPASAYGESTKSVVSRALFPATVGKQAEVDRRIVEALQARLNAEGSRAAERAEEVITWIRSTDQLRGEYGTNLQAVLRAETVAERNFGIAVSAVSAWAKAQDRELERTARQQAAANSQHVGTVGERLRDIELTLSANPRFFEGNYGTTTLLTFTDAAGNIFKWFASGTRDYKVGTVFSVTGTVKEHEVYNETKNTALTRCKLTEKEPVSVGSSS